MPTFLFNTQPLVEGIASTEHVQTARYVWWDAVRQSEFAVEEEDLVDEVGQHEFVVQQLGQVVTQLLHRHHHQPADELNLQTQTTFTMYAITINPRTNSIYKHKQHLPRTPSPSTHGRTQSTNTNNIYHVRHHHQPTDELNLQKQTTFTR